MGGEGERGRDGGARVDGSGGGGWVRWGISVKELGQIFFKGACGEEGVGERVGRSVVGVRCVEPGKAGGG